jgi:acylglycerol lipase
MKKWLPPPDQATLAKLVFVHGYDDHCDRYYELFPRLAHRGIAVTSWDQRGWGRSAKTTKDWGITGPTEVVISDLVEVVKSAADEEPREAKLFLMGHSMGGAEVLTFASSTQPAHTELLRTTVHGILLDSPHIALSPEQENPKIKIILGRLAARLLPNFQLRHKMPASTITRDPAVQKSMDSDPLLRATGTLQGMSGLLDRALFLHEGKVHLSPEVKSLWLAHGSGDKSTDYNASKAWFERECAQRAKNGEDLAMKTYEGWSHTLHCDLPDNRHVFANDSADWILARVGQAGTAQADVVPAAAVAIGGESAANAAAKEIAAEEGQKVERPESKGESKL